MKVEQFHNKNQFHMWSYDEAVDYLQSYDSLVVKIEYKTADTIGQPTQRIITLGRDWDYSTTTSKHVYMFLEEYACMYIPTTNKRSYVNKLIQDGVIQYDENMR